MFASLCVVDVLLLGDGVFSVHSVERRMRNESESVALGSLRGQKVRGFLSRELCGGMIGRSGFV